MADEPVVAPETENQDTPVSNEAASTETPAAVQDKSPDTNWEQRYNDLRPEFDRKSELVAALEGRHGPEAQQQALAQFGVELQDDTEYDDDLDDEYLDPRDKQIEELVAWKQEQENERFGRLEDEYIKETLGELENGSDVQLTAKEKKLVTNNALAARMPDGRPDLQGALDDLLEIQGAARDRYRESKRNTPKAPVGAAGEDKINLSDKEARQAYMAEVFEAEGGLEQEEI